MQFPAVTPVSQLDSHHRRLLITAYGFEERALGWPESQYECAPSLSQALIFRYVRPKGRNRIAALRRAVARLCTSLPVEVRYDVRSPHTVETHLDLALKSELNRVDEVVVDISSMTKLMILVCLCKLAAFPGTVRIVYSEPKDYAPSQAEYAESKGAMEKMARFPSRGFDAIIRARCLSSIRMQGQPVILVAFTSFNEQLIRHMLGTISPHRLLFINGRPPRADYSWREHATQEIHQKLIEEYSVDNPCDRRDSLKRAASTLDYRETFRLLESIYSKYGAHERIIVAATGSKMQIVGLFFGKMAHPDIHIEYPTPDSYFVKGLSKGIRQVHEVVVPEFRSFLQGLAEDRRKYPLP